MFTKTLIYPLTSDLINRELWKTLTIVELNGFPSASQELQKYSYPDTDPKGYLGFLGLSSDATAEQIKLAYKVKLYETHPDRGGSKEQFEYLIEAYTNLSDPQARAEYHSMSPDEPSQEQILADYRRLGIPLTEESYVEENVTVGAAGYTYYTTKDEEVDEKIVRSWYEEMLKVYHLFGINESPRIAIHDLGKAFDWSKITENVQIAHFDKSIKPNFITALAATIKSNKIRF